MVWSAAEWSPKMSMSESWDPGTRLGYVALRLLIGRPRDREIVLDYPVGAVSSQGP